MFGIFYIDLLYKVCLFILILDIRFIKDFSKSKKKILFGNFVGNLIVRMVSVYIKFNIFWVVNV